MGELGDLLGFELDRVGVGGGSGGHLVNDTSPAGPAGRTSLLPAEAEGGLEFVRVGAVDLVFRGRQRGGVVCSEYGVLST